MSNPIFGVIFDLDGVIVSTDNCHYLAWKRMADEEGIYFDRTINERLRGVSRMESLDIILERAQRTYTDDEKQAMATRKNAYYVELIGSLTRADILPGALDTLRYLKGRGVKVAIGSSSKNTPIILRQIGLENAFDAVADGNAITRSKPDPEVFVLAARLLGLSPEHFGTARLYATGSQRQQNDAHMLEWLAARCAARFFATGFRGADSHNIDCYYYQCHTPRFGWDSFDSDGALYHARYGALLKAGAVFVTECYPTLAAYLRQGRRSLGRVSYCAAFFHRAAHAPLSARERLGRRLDALYGFFAFYLNWVYQVVLTLPPALRGADGAPDGLPENELAHAATLEALHAFLASQGRDEAACRQAQQGLARLVSGPAADRRDMARVISGLGAGARADSPDDALAAFLSVLLTAVMEDG